MENNERQFKGVWIEKEIWLDKRLNALEKVIFTEINSLDKEESGCYASNKYLAEFCQCSETKVSTAISKLIELGYLYVKSFDGRIRVLKSRIIKNESQTLKNLKADIKDFKDNNKDNNKNNNNKEVLLDGFSLSEKVRTMVYVWLGYKKEKGQTYKPVGLNALLKKVEKWQNEFGEEYVISAIDSSITNNYAGLFPAKQQYKPQNTQNYAHHNYTKEQLSGVFDSLDDTEI